MIPDNELQITRLVKLVRRSREEDRLMGSKQKCLDKPPLGASANRFALSINILQESSLLSSVNEPKRCSAASSFNHFPTFLFPFETLMVLCGLVPFRSANNHHFFSFKNHTLFSASILSPPSR